MTSVTYQDEIVPNDGPTYSTVSNIKGAIKNRFTSKNIEDFGFTNQNIVSLSRMDGLAQAMHMAYSKHNAFTWSPDSLWLRIAQGLATHIRLNSETLREKIVGFEGKKELNYGNDSFVKGKHNPWELVFDNLSQQIGENTNGKIYDLFTKPFSTTKEIHTAVANGILMDACADYFEYSFTTCCGIPRFYFTGTKKDWEDLVYRCEQLKYYGMDQWYGVLKPILDEFLNAVNGQFNPEFWRNMYKIDGGSGGPYISGWVSQLYPYLAQDKRNKYLSRQPRATFDNLTTSDFSCGLSTVPFTWHYYEYKYPMEMIVGSLGVHQDSDNGSLSPAYGWVIVQK